jgi:hypothetical protein
VTRSSSRTCETAALGPDLGQEEKTLRAGAQAKKGRRGRDLTYAERPA